MARHKIIDSLRRRERETPAVGGSTALEIVQNIAEQLDESDLQERTEFNHLIHRALDQVRNST